MASPADTEALTERLRSFVRSALDELAASGEWPRRDTESPWPESTLTYWAVKRVCGKDGDELPDALSGAFPGKFEGYRADERFQWLVGLVRGVVVMHKLDEPWSADPGEAINKAIGMLLNRLPEEGRHRFIQVVAQVDSREVAGLEVGGVQIEPVRDGLHLTLSRFLPEAAKALRDAYPGPGRSSLLIVDVTGDGDGWLLMPPARLKVFRVVAALRLLSGATIGEAAEVYGEPSVVKQHEPNGTVIEGGGMFDWYQRELNLTTALVPAAEWMINILERAPSGSIAIAINRFSRTFRAGTWTDTVIDLAVALEAAFGVDDPKAELTLPIKLRTAMLLAHERDSAAAIFEDVGLLYKVRGKIVHGQPLNENFWTKILRQLSIDTDHLSSPNDKIPFVIDRWRDILRRAIVARLVLAQEDARREKTLWPFGMTSVERILVEDVDRGEWTSALHEATQVIGAPEALAPAVPLEYMVGRRSWED